MTSCTFACSRSAQHWDLGAIQECQDLANGKWELGKCCKEIYFSAAVKALWCGLVVCVGLRRWAEIERRKLVYATAML